MRRNVIAPNISLDSNAWVETAFSWFSLPASLQQTEPLGPVFGPAEDENAGWNHHDTHPQQDADRRQLRVEADPVEQAAADARQRVRERAGGAGDLDRGRQPGYTGGNG